MVLPTPLFLWLLWCPILKSKDLDLRTTLRESMRYGSVWPHSLWYVQVPLMYLKTIYTANMPKPSTREKAIPSTNDAGKTGYPHLKKGIRPSLITLHKNQVQMNQRPQREIGNPEMARRQRKQHSTRYRCRKDFLSRDPFAWEGRPMVNKWDLIKLKGFWMANNCLKDRTEWERILASFNIRQRVNSQTI